MTGRTDSRVPENQSQRQHILTVVVENIAQAFPAQLQRRLRRTAHPPPSCGKQRLHKLQRRRFQLLQQKTFLLLTLIRQLIIAITILLGDASSALDDVSIEDLGDTTGLEVRYEDRVYDEGRHFGYSRGTFCCIPERDSFHMIGHPNSQKSAELSNPGPGQWSKIVTE